MSRPQYEFTPHFADEIDKKDPLAHYRQRFYIPEKNGSPVIYFCGNSLGLQPRSAKEHLETDLEDWKRLGVEGHFHARNPWFYYHKRFSEKEARLIGAKPSEVVVMNTLTVNLHLLLVSFYRPAGKRVKILMEAGSFPSDRYAVESQIRDHGLDPRDVLVELEPREGKHTLDTGDIESKIKELGEELALVFLPGVQYYTGQRFDLSRITVAAHNVGAMAGYDLAHATGNVPVELHNWQVDFAAWCSYKYLNSGPGGVSGVYIHEKHGENDSIPRFAGWWGHDEERRFLMEKTFHPQKGAAGWQLSNAQVLPMAVHKAALDIFDAAGMEQLRKKSLLLTGYLEYLIREAGKETGADFRVITPENENERGAQLSIMTFTRGKEIYENLGQHNIVADWREPGVIRVAPVPLYNTFREVYTFGKVLKDSWEPGSGV